MEIYQIIDELETMAFKARGDTTLENRLLAMAAKVREMEKEIESKNKQEDTILELEDRIRELTIDLEEARRNL